MIGKLEEMVLLSLLRCGDDAPASSVFEELTTTIGKEKSFGSIYTTLDRMVAKKFVTENVKCAESGKTRRFFSISLEGRNELANSMNSTIKLSEGIQLPGLV